MPPLSKKSLQAGLTAEVQTALMGLHGVKEHATPASSSGNRATAALDATDPTSQAQIRSAAAAKVAAKASKSQATAAGGLLRDSLNRLASADKERTGSDKPQAASDAAVQVVNPAAERHSRRDRSADPQASNSRQPPKRRRSRSRSPSTVQEKDSRASRGRKEPARRHDTASRRQRTRY